MWLTYERHQRDVPDLSAMRSERSASPAPGGSTLITSAPKYPNTAAGMTESLSHTLHCWLGQFRMQEPLNLQHAPRWQKAISKDALHSGFSLVVTCAAKVACHNLAQIQHLQHALCVVGDHLQDF